MRTLIVAQGLERARILAAVSIHAPNKVIVLRNSNEVTQEVARDVQKHLLALKKEILEERRGFKPYPFVFEVETKAHKTNFFDVARAYGDISNLIKIEKANGNDVSIDISTGNKTVSLAMFLAAQINKVPTTYCKAGKYGKRGSSEIASIAKEPVQIPAFPIVFEDIPFDVLHKIAGLEKVDSISSLVRELGLNLTKSNIISVSRKLDDLQGQGYVKITRCGKRKKIRITQLGSQMSKLSF